MRLFMDAAAPGILLGHAVGRTGDWFNQELFDGPSDLPWGLEVDHDARPAGHGDVSTFHPTLLYGGLWDAGPAVLLIAVGARFPMRPPGVFCLYVAGCTLGRMWWELLRIDSRRTTSWVSG